MWRCAARVHRKLPFRWVSMTVSQSSSLILKRRLSRMTAALLTRMSSAPSSATVRSTAASTCSRERTSQPIAIAVPPSRVIASTVSAQSSSRRSLTATCAPSAASLIAVAAPIPRPAPVTSAARPSSRAMRPDRSRSGSEPRAGPPHAEPARGVGLERQRDRQRVLGLVVEVDQRVAVAQRQRDLRLAAGELVDRDDRRALPVTAVREHGRHAGVEQLEGPEAELGALAPAADQALEPAQQRVRIAALRVHVDALGAVVAAGHRPAQLARGREAAVALRQPLHRRAHAVAPVDLEV